MYLASLVSKGIYSSFFHLFPTNNIGCKIRLHWEQGKANMGTISRRIFSLCTKCHANVHLKFAH